MLYDSIHVLLYEVRSAVSHYPTLHNRSSLESHQKIKILESINMPHVHSTELVGEITSKAQQIRIQVLKMVFNAQSGHIGGAFSAAEILAALYFHHLRIDP